MNSNTQTTIYFLNKGTILVTIISKADFTKGDLLVLDGIKVSMELSTC